MRVCAKQVLHNHPISGGKVSISIISVDTKTKSKSCTVDMTVDGEYGGSIGGSLIPSSVVTTRIGSKRVMFSWSQPLKSYSGKSLKKVSIDITITDAFTEAIENDLLTLLNVHVPQLKLKSSKNSSKLEIKDKLKRILIDYAAFEGLEQLNDLLKLDFGCSHAHVDSGLSSELPMVPDSHLDSDLEGCPIQQTSSSELPFN